MHAHWVRSTELGVEYSSYDTDKLVDLGINRIEKCSVVASQGGSEKHQQDQTKM